MKPFIIVIEGVDGAGKNTQATLLTEYLNKAGLNTRMFSFPNYTDFFGKEIGHYLNGDYGSIENIPTKLISTVYAADRFKFFQDNREKLEKLDVLVFDRYVDSNVIYQRCKSDIDNHVAFSMWLRELEYEIFKCPKPDLNLFLDMDYANSSAQVEKKDTRNYTDKKKDLHESNKSYLEKVYKEFRMYFFTKNLDDPKHWKTINCLDLLGNVAPIDHIHMNIQGIVSPFITKLLERET